MHAWSRRHICASLAGVFAISFLLIFLLMDRRLNIFDEGLVLVNAVRTLHGDVIHRDFYSPYGPAAYSVLALLFSLDPHWFLIGRIYGVAVMAGIVATTFGLLACRTRLPVALAFTAICGTWMHASAYYLYPLFPSILLTLIGSALLLHWMEQGGRGYLLAAGCTAGGVALFRYDAGFFILAAHMVAIALHALIMTERAGRLGSIAKSGIVYCLGTALIFLPFTIYYVFAAPLAAFANDIIDYPLHHYAAMRGLPFPGPRALSHNIAEFGVYLPVLAVLLGAMRIGALSRGLDGAPARHLTFLIVFVPVAAILYYKGMVRVSWIHMLMSIIPAGVVLAVLVDGLWGKPLWKRLLAALLFGVAAVPPAQAAIHRGGLKTWSPLGQLLSRSGLIQLKAEAGDACPSTTALTLAWLNPDYLRVSSYIRRFSRPDETIFVAVDRHDKIFSNPVGLYISAERRPGTRWHQFDPGLQTRADIQSQIIQDLGRNHIRWIIRDSSFDDEHEPNLSSRSSSVHLLDHYIAANYRPVAVAGKVQIWLINGVHAPVSPFWPDCPERPTLEAGHLEKTGGG